MKVWTFQTHIVELLLLWDYLILACIYISFTYNKKKGLTIKIHLRKDIEVSLKKEYNDLKQRNQQHGGVMNGRDWYATQAYRGK